MALIIINGVVLPTPNSIQVSVMDISRAERNANGNMTIERINTKVKLAIGYEFLTSTDLQSVLSNISGTYFNVTFLDPRTNNFVTKSMYSGDRNVGMLDFFDGNPRYKDVSFDLIER